MNTASNSIPAENIIPMPRVARLPRETFKHRGKNWRIFKRTADADANWYFYFEQDRQRRLFSLGTSAKALAIQEAKLKIDLAAGQRLDALRASMVRPRATAPAPAVYCTLGDVFKHVLGEDLNGNPWPKLAIKAHDGTRRNYVKENVWIFRKLLALPDARAVWELSADVLNKANVRKFFADTELEAQELDRTEGQHAGNRRRATARSAFNNAKAIFGRLALEYLRDLGLALPPLDDWRNGLIYADKGSNIKAFEAPAAGIIRKTLVEWRRLGDTPGYAIPGGSHSAGQRDKLAPLAEVDRRNLFIAVGLELSCGLRAGEVPQVRWEHCTTLNVRARLICTRVNVKNKTGKLDVSPLNPFWRVLHDTCRRNGWTGAPGEVMIQNDQKTNWPADDASRWLRWLGWRTVKTNHALRDLAASWVTMKYGLHRAQKYARHAQISTTEAHYSHFVTEEGLENKQLTAWLKWA